MLEFEHLYKAIEDKQNGFVLHKDGRQVPCHKLQPIPTQGFGGQVNLIRLPCCTQCGKATITLYENQNVYRQSCDGVVSEFILDEIISENNPEAKLLKI